MSTKKIPGLSGTDFYYDGQLKRLLLQFMAVFTGMHVKVGKFRNREAGLVPIPIYHGKADRVVSAIMSNNTATKPISVPCMSAIINGVRLDARRNAGLDMDMRVVSTPLGGIAPNDTRVTYLLNPYVYEIEFQLNILTSNTDQMSQIMEQILLMFGSPLVIQTSDSPFDRASITDITLSDIQMNSNYPINLDPKLDSTTLTFTAPAYISAPVEVMNNIIKTIKLRVGAINQSSDDSIVQQLNDMDVEYMTVADISELEI